jgi:hypothetical protein
MSRIFQCGFEMGHVDCFDAFGSDATKTTVVTTPTGGSWSGYAAKFAQGTGLNTLALGRFNTGGTQSELYVRYRFRMASGIAASNTLLSIVEFKNASGEQCNLAIRTDALQLIARKGTTVLGTAVGALSLDRWYLIEIHVIVSDTVGVFDVKVDGTTILSLGSSLDTKTQTDNAQINTITFFGAAGGISNFLSYIDDIAVNDTAGSVNNSWVGDGRISALIPNGAGDTQQFTKNTGASNQEAVDEIPPDDDTTYVADSVSGHKELETLSASDSNTGVVNGVGVWIRAKKTDAGAQSIETLIKNGTTEDAGTSTALTTAYVYYRKIYDLDPDSVAAWTKADLDALQAGAKIP